MNKEQALAFLCKDGNLRVPCSRYGSDTEDCAPVAFALAEIAQEANGDEITEEALDFYMGLVVNDHDDVLSLIEAHGSPEQRELIEDLLDEEDEIEELPACERCGQDVEPDWVEIHKCFSEWTGPLTGQVVKVLGYSGVAWRVRHHSEEQQRVVAVIIGDDREVIHDDCDVTVITDDDYCHECGSTTCGHGRP